MPAKSFQLCPALCNPMNCSPPGSSVRGILWARMLEWVAMLSSRGIFQHRDRTESLVSPALAGGFFTTSATWEALVLFCDEHKILKEIRVFPPGIKLATYVNKLFP